MKAAEVLAELPRPARFLLTKFGVPVNAIIAAVEAVPASYLQALQEMASLSGAALDMGPASPPAEWWPALERQAPAVGVSAELLAALASVKHETNGDDWRSAIAHALLEAGPRLAPTVKAGAFPAGLLGYAADEYGDGEGAAGWIVAAFGFMVARRGRKIADELDPAVIDSLAGLLVEGMEAE